MTQSKELKQVRDALVYSRERAYMQNSKRLNFTKSESLERDEGIQQIEKALSTLDRIIAAPTPEQTEIDLEVLKREVGEYVSKHYSKSRPAVDFTMELLAATGRLKV